MLFLYVVLPLSAGLGAAFLLGHHSLEQRIEERMQEDVELIARAMRGPLSRSLERGREGTVHDAVSSAFSLDPVYGAYVYDRDGEIIATAGQTVDLPSRREVSELAEAGDRKGEYGTVAGRSVYSYFVPLTDSGGRISGLLHVTRRASDFEEYVMSVRRQSLLLFGLAVSIMTVLVLWGHQGAVGRHLRRLLENMSRVEGGDRRHRASPQGPREIVRIETAFNRMLDSITRAEREVQKEKANRAALQKQLRQAEKLAAVGRLSAGVAHEVGTPLCIIDGKVQRLLRTQRSDSCRGELEDIRFEVRRLETIVRQLLDFSRRNPLRRRWVSAEQLAGAALDSLRSSPEGNGVRLELGGERPAPQLHVDVFRLEQALVNLLRNAAHASPRGTVRIGWFTRDGEACFVVEDDGPGVAGEIEDRLFEPFFTTKEVGEGTGLGLAVVHGIAEEHKGRITVGESRWGGACFRLHLPCPEAGPGQEKPAR